MELRGKKGQRVVDREEGIEEAEIEELSPLLMPRLNDLHLD